MDIKILVAMHKPSWIPADSVYYPLHVGASGKSNIKGTVPDDSGDNISDKNPYFCELTGLYWAWKNLKCDYIGLCHYRRYFSHYISPNSVIEKKQEKIFKRENYESLLKKYDIILPYRFVHIKEDVQTQYIHCHHQSDLMIIKDIIQQDFPDYQEAFDAVMRERSQHTCNMFVTKKHIFDLYCEWLFSVLFKAEKIIDAESYDTYQARVFGFLSERLFDVWLYKHNSEFSKTEVDVVLLEEEHKKKSKIIKEYIRTRLWSWLKA